MFDINDKVALNEDMADDHMSDNILPEGSEDTVIGNASPDGQVVNVKMDIDDRVRSYDDVSKLKKVE